MISEVDIRDWEHVGKAREQFEKIVPSTNFDELTHYQIYLMGYRAALSSVYQKQIAALFKEKK